MQKHIVFSGLLAVSILSLAFVFAIVPVAHAQTATTCPAGYTCNTNTPVTPPSVNCPAGFTCTTNPTPVTPNPTPVTCPVGFTCNTTIPSTGAALSIFQSGSDAGANGVVFNIQANGSSNMQVNGLTVDFNTRPWLYFSSIGLLDQTTGQILVSAPISNSNFTEIVVGQDYRYKFNGLNFTVPRGQTVELVLNLSNGNSSVPVQPATQVISALVRAVDNAGVTYTASTNSSSVSGIVASLDPSSPQASNVQISTSAQTNNVLLAVFDIKSQGSPSTLQGLNININTVGQSVQNLFSNIQIKASGQTYSARYVSPTGPVRFNNMTIPLPANTYVPITVYATVAQDTNTNHYLDGSKATVSLLTGEIQAVDSNYNLVPVTNNEGVAGNTITFNGSGVQVSNTSATQGPTPCYTAPNCPQQVLFTFSLTAGNQPIFVSNKEIGRASCRE